MFLLNCNDDIEKEILDTKSVFVHSDEIELQFRNAEAINKDFTQNPFYIIYHIFNNVSVFIVNIVVIIFLKNKVEELLLILKDC